MQPTQTRHISQHAPPGTLQCLVQEYMETFGFLIVALTMIQNRDWGKKEGDKKPLYEHISVMR